MPKFLSATYHQKLLTVKYVDENGDNLWRMINQRRFSRLASLRWALFIFVNPAIAVAGDVTIRPFTEITLMSSHATYNTEMFNLLRNRKNVIDGKNYYQKNFSATFESLLLKSQSAQSKPEAAQLKKRLISGPAAKPRAFTSNATQKVYIYYDACQAHDCDKTRLGLLYETESKSMRAKLIVGGKEEFLGAASESERALLDYLQPNSAR